MQIKSNSPHKYKNEYTMYSNRFQHMQKTLKTHNFLKYGQLNTKLKFKIYLHHH